MSEGAKNGTLSSLPLRKTRKIPVMAPTRRMQSSCSANAENNNPYSQGQTGLLRNRLGNRIRKPVLSESRQNHIPAKPLPHPIRKPHLQTDISKSTPDLSRPVRPLHPKILPFGNPLHKLNSLDSLPKVPPPARLPANPNPPPKAKPPPNEVKKPKRPEVAKKLILDTKRGQKQVDAKRKVACMDIPKQKMTAKELLSPTAVPPSMSPPKNRMEECSKIVKKIMLDKKMLEMGERKRSSGEFDDSIGTFDSDEMVELLMNDSHLRHLDTTRISADLDSKSSKRNSSEFEDSIGSFFSDQMVLHLSKSNEFLSAKPNLLGDNPDDLDNITPAFSDLSNALDRTPSAEELPLECEPEPSGAPLPEPVSARSTSPELPPESLSSRTPNAPVSIITSITSIMSLDTGYQGDGELSRPESRNTETESRPKLPVVDSGIRVKTINFDDGKTMTDSDFFTESDADVHDDLSAAAAEIGSGKGDRKAQVIDGTLYAGAFMQTQPCTRRGSEAQGGAPEHLVALAGSGVNEDMESSGIFSDVDKKTEEVQPPVSYLGLITEQMKTIQNLALLVQEGRWEGIVKSSSAESSSTVQEMGSVKKDEKKGRSEQTKKCEMPSRNAASKMKGVTETPGGDGDARRKTVKKGKWDAVMDKIAQGKEENKYTPSKFRDIKSKVFQNIGPLIGGRKNDGKGNSPTSGQPKSRSRRSTRIRNSESSLVSPKSKLSRTTASPNSSQRSSLSDVSLSAKPHHKSASRSNKKRESISPPSNDSTNPASTPIRKPNVGDSTANGGTPCRNSDLQNTNPVRTPSATAPATMKTPSVRKTPTPRRSDAVGQSLHRTASVPLKDSNHNGIISKSGSAVIINNNNNNNNNKNSTSNNNNNSSTGQTNNKVRSAQSFQSKSLKATTRTPNPVQAKNGCLLAVAKESNKALLKQLKHNSKAFESLAVLFAYCTNDLDAFSTPHLKQKLEAERSKAVQAQSDLQELQSRLIRVREELNDKEIVIAELKNDKISLIEESERFQKAVEDLKSELKAATEQKLEAEGELLRECENIRNLRRELSDRTDSHDREKNSLVNSLLETRKENCVLKSANREIKEEYDRCLVENQRLVELINKRQNEAARAGKENLDSDDRRRRPDAKEKSPSRTPVHDKPHRTSLNGPPNTSSLESEVESLRQVLALKTDEVTELRRQELSLRENADRVPKLLSTITMLEGKVEDLQSQLSSQTETVRDLFKSNDHLEEELKSASIQKTRLTHKNEELQYKLKQYAEAMKQLANQKNLSEKNIKSEYSPVRSNSKKLDGSLDDSVKSQMKAVVEKSDSVSYMLEMTEDSSEIVTNIIRRAESLRSNNRDGTLPKKKRTKAASVSSVDADRFKRNSSTEDDFRPDLMSTPNSSPCDDDFDAHMSIKTLSPAPSPLKYPVRLTQDDFSTDSIELANDNDCEVIEITKNFDKIDKMLTSMTSSSSSSNGSHFDIESDVFSNLENEHNLDEDTENSEFQESGSVIRTFRREGENIQPVLPVYADLDAGHSLEEEKAYSKNLVKMPKVSGGEAMIGLSSDDEDIRKIKLCNE